VTAKFRQVFGVGKPVIAMVHFGALPGSPLYDGERGVDGLVDGVTRTSMRCSGPVSMR